MGRPKPLLRFGRETMIGAVVAALREGGVGEVVVVAAPGDAALAGWVRERGLTLAINPSPEDGMLSTIRAGLAALGGTVALAGADRPVLVTPADLPRLSAATVRAVIAALAGGADLAVPVDQGRRGHPLGIAPALLPEIDDLEPTVGLRALLAGHPSAVQEIAVDDPGAVHDVDTPEDYARLASGP